MVTRKSAWSKIQFVNQNVKLWRKLDFCDVLICLFDFILKTENLNNDSQSYAGDCFAFHSKLAFCENFWFHLIEKANETISTYLHLLSVSLSNIFANKLRFLTVFFKVCDLWLKDFLWVLSNEKRYFVRPICKRRIPTKSGYLHRKTGRKFNFWFLIKQKRMKRMKQQFQKPRDSIAGSFFHSQYLPISSKYLQNVLHNLRSVPSCCDDLILWHFLAKTFLISSRFAFI